MMQKSFLLGLIFFLTACALPSGEQKAADFPTLISEALGRAAKIEEAKDPHLALPADIHASQVGPFFKLDDLWLAPAVDRWSPEKPVDFAATFVGILIARKGDKSWLKFTEVKDARSEEADPHHLESHGNSPSYLWTSAGRLMVSVVDQNGAGSGEGFMKIFSFTPPNKWNLKGCYYFGYNDTDGASLRNQDFGSFEKLSFEDCEGDVFFEAQFPPGRVSKP